MRVFLGRRLIVSIDKNQIFMEIQSCLFSGRHVSYPHFFKCLYFSPPSEVKKAKDITGLPQSITHFVLSLCYTNDESCSISRTNKCFGNNTSVSCGRWELTKSFIWGHAFSEKCWINSLPVDFCAILKRMFLAKRHRLLLWVGKGVRQKWGFVVVVVFKGNCNTLLLTYQSVPFWNLTLLCTGIIYVCVCVGGVLNGL